MNREPAQGVSKFKVVCTWFEAIIRRDSVKDSRKMCLRCYARMMNEHARAHQHAHKLLYASER